MGVGQAAIAGWRVALRLGRVSNLPTVWTDVLAGTALAGGALAPGRLALLLCALSLFYVAGMFLNDACDREVDARERPERPIPAGEVSAAVVFSAAAAMIAFALLLLAAIGWAPFGAGLALTAAILYYDLHHKANPLSPLVMGLCRMLIYVIAALAVSPALPPVVLLGAAVLFAYLIGLTYVAKQENLSELHHIWPLLFLAAPFLYGLPRLGAGIVQGAIYAGFLVWTIQALWLLRSGARRDIRRAVVSFIAGISLLDALLIAGQGQTAAAGMAAAGFGLTLFLQRYVPGT